MNFNVRLFADRTDDVVRCATGGSRPRSQGSHAARPSPRLWPLVIEQSRKLIVGEPGLADYTPDNSFRQIEAVMIGNRHPPGLGGMLQLHVGAGLFVNLKPGLLQGTKNLPWPEAAESGHQLRRSP